MSCVMKCVILSDFLNFTEIDSLVLLSPCQNMVYCAHITHTDTLSHTTDLSSGGVSSGNYLYKN